MNHVLLYWNHICVLHKREKQFLEQLAKTLREENIALEVRYFGLGYPEHMSEYLSRPDAVLPDIIVSADLEVFEHPPIFRKFSAELFPAAQWMPLRHGPALDAVWRGETLLPFLSIPLVYYTREPERCARTALSEWDGLAFGGINNSAVKTVVKTVWSQHGREAAEGLLSRSSVLDMPIGAFQAVRQGASQTALVPSLYALRADGQKTFLCQPGEGPLLIPSYLCARNSISESTARRVVQGILCQELCNFYCDNGDLIVYPAVTEKHSCQECGQYNAPSLQWLQSMSSQEFYALYCKKLPTARNLDTALPLTG